MNRCYLIFTTTLWLFSGLVVQSWVAAASAEPASAYKLPLFRSVEAAPGKVPAAAGGGPVRLLADADFPPFSFTAQTGGPAGLAVELALAACAEAKLRCEVSLRPFGELLPALASGAAEAIIAGPRIEEPVLRGTVMTRPWFRTMARFTVLSGSPLTASDAPSLSEKRIGVVKDTVHARWLEAYYADAEILVFNDEARAREALRSGEVDSLFGDNLRSIYWVSGAASHGCCRLLGGAYSDFDHFSRNIAFLVRASRPDLRAAFDYGLDLAQVNGTTEKIFNTYVPLNPW